jgi:hypothetical protein
VYVEDSAVIACIPKVEKQLPSRAPLASRKFPPLPMRGPIDDFT